MHKYFIKMPRIIRMFYPEYVWRIPTQAKEVFLSFDDGPHPAITPWVLDELKKYNAKATFFCIGKNVERYPEVYRRILEEGHAVGNHTHDHLNGWSTKDETYLDNIKKASEFIRSSLFRPPYGRIRRRQAKKIGHLLPSKRGRIIMWDVLSGDFDASFSSAQCYANVIDHVSKGSVVVFHDSEKAFGHLKQVLPDVLEYLGNEGYIFSRIDMQET